MYNRRVPKSDPRIEAGGSIDELNVALGLARASATDAFVTDNLLLVQKDLITVMGDLATLPEDRERYLKDGFVVVTADLTRKLDVLAAELESRQISFKGWATPGATLGAATLDWARVTCRRAERCVTALIPEDKLNNPEIVIYLNRLSDVLWLLARWVETTAKL